MIVNLSLAVPHIDGILIRPDDEIDVSESILCPDIFAENGDPIKNRS